MSKKVLFKKVASLGLIMISATAILSGCGKTAGEAPKEVQEEVKGESPEEQAALAAVKDMRENLKSKQSLKLYSVTVKDDDKYRIKIDYAADNSFGGSVDDIQYYNIEKDTLEPEKVTQFSELFSNGGRTERIEQEYNDCSEKEISIDTDWIMSNFE